MSQLDLLYRYMKERTGLSEQEFVPISACFQPFSYKTNTFLLREGEVCQHNYFVTKGSFRMYHVNAEGMELTRYFAFENKFGTNLTSLIEGSPSIENLQAIEPLEVLRISKSDFFGLVENNPPVNKIYRNILENAYITSQKRIYDLQGMTALDRLRWLLGQYPMILTRIPSRMIASYLGITPYTLSRLKAQL
ncbi:Crp/Fnr family transcriptional regulator [Algoriphagus sp. AK58]|uniref:Crp/Fnr family transcriptional regulator n=1 Tax=Algoriphagus sp. AK58 TaxID=1406877 RepID=UPI0016506D63|nr:Crp/Fnr family transcriptional regulator [Algoriphagus sp. AK58]MBC6367956.1 Crp/Fnr family transcriptional regulator [Algoriphagus sp. AK58]